MAHIYLDLTLEMAKRAAWSGPGEARLVLDPTY
jgi:hypothetical protein